MEQESHFLPTLSVWETLMFHSYLRLPEHSHDHKLLMQETLHSMGLFSIRNSRVRVVDSSPSLHSPLARLPHSLSPPATPPPPLPFPLILSFASIL